MMEYMVHIVPAMGVAAAVIALQACVKALCRWYLNGMLRF